MTVATKAPEELFPGVPWKRWRTGYQANFGGHSCLMGWEGRVTFLAAESPRSSSHSGPDALTWLRAQCIAALRADVERAGFLMVEK